ncbi:MAG: peptide MFS transporter [Tannerella sp.]|jgi:POT family proton-dependent oligopeptide transporter|nr:peptide MFS transporter [Tannerella sp.]
MFKNHPRGLYALALANTGERFGYYTMLAIFVLFLQAKFGFSAIATGQIFSTFLAAVYFMPLVGGILADKWLGYGKTVTIGIVVMFTGYLLLAIPSEDYKASLIFMFGALALIAIGTGLFKGNLQVMVGNLYDAPEYRDRRDSAFSLFYMAINIGALFAPTAATKVTNYFLGTAGLTYNPRIPALAHRFLDGSIDAAGKADLTALAASQPVPVSDLAAFSQHYISRLSEAYNYGFGVACLSLIVSILIYVIFRKTFKQADFNPKQAKAQAAATGVKLPELGKRETRERITALVLVFAVVIFFWMAFHQNGLTLTYFARDYTSSQVNGFSRLWFDVINLALLAVAVYAVFGLFQSERPKGKGISGLVLAFALAALIVRYTHMPAVVHVLPQIFQQFNPFFVVALTPVSLALFGHLAAKKKEPSAPRKIGMGMVVAALGFTIMAVGSLGLKTPNALASTGGVSDALVSPNWLIGTYLTLTFAELLLSPMGMSFVSKVAPPKYKGLMMGGWFAATAVGNYMVSFISNIWGDLPLWMVWSVLIVLCLLSALFIFSIMKRLEKVAA